MNRFEIYSMINKERDRQDEKHPNQNLDTFIYMGCQILGEEVGEVNKAWLEQDSNNLVEELVQVAAVCVRWLELIEKEQG